MVQIYLVGMMLLLVGGSSAQNLTDTERLYRDYLVAMRDYLDSAVMENEGLLHDLVSAMAMYCKDQLIECTNSKEECLFEVHTNYPKKKWRIKISSQTHVFQYSSPPPIKEELICTSAGIEPTIAVNPPTSVPCQCDPPTPDIMPTLKTTNFIATSKTTDVMPTSKTTDVMPTSKTTEFRDQNIICHQHDNITCGQDDSQPSPLLIIGFLALGFVAGIAVTTVVFCIVLRKRQSKASSGAALRTDFQTKSDNMESRNSQAGNSVIYNELDEPKQISHVLPIKRENVSAAQNYEAPCVPKSDQHVYSPIQADFSATPSEVTTTPGEKNIEDGNVDHVYNHLHEYRDANNSRDSAGDYDHLQDGGGRSRQNFFRERTQIGGREKQNTNKPKESAGDNYFTLSKQEESGAEKTVDNDGSNSDNYFTLSKQDLSGAEKSADNKGSNSDNYFTLSRQALSGAEKSADIEGSNSDNYFTLSKQDLSGAEKSADNDGSNSDN